MPTQQNPRRKKIWLGMVFAQMLYDKALWKKWSSRDTTKAAGWAPMPEAPKVETSVPTAGR